MSPSSSPPPTPSTPRTALPSLLLSTQSRSSAAPTTSSSLLSATTAAHALDFDYDLDPSTITERPSLSLSRVASRASLRSTSTGARGAGASRLASEVASLASVDKDEAEHRVAQKGDDADRDKEEEKAQDDDDDPLSDSSSVSSGFEGILSRVNGGGRTVIGESGKVQTKSKMIATERGKEKDEADTSTERASIPFPTIASLTATSSSSSSLRSASKSRPASPHRSHGPAGVLSTKEGEEDDDEDEDMAAVLVEREEGQADPREMLREQLRRTTTNLRPGLPGRDTEGSSWTVGRSSGREEDGELAVEKKRYREEGRRYFILSTAGKLVFTTDKDESLATGYASVMQAIISIFADEGDRLRMVEAPPVRIYFLLKPPLYLVAVSDWGETEGIMRTHLEYLHLLVISVVTNAQLKNIFGRRQNFDLRRLLEGTEGFFTTLTNTLQTSLSIMMGSLEVYRIEKSVRDDVAAALKVGKIDDLLYVLLISSSRIVTLLRPKRHSIHPTDLHLLLTPILSSTTFRSPGGESWIPICLPKFNDTGFLHAYISFVTEATGVV
ncbi:vacuolar fusion protein MON1, partial [Pseudohyphozyma bogoriensis]